MSSAFVFKALFYSFSVNGRASTKFQSPKYLVETPKSRSSSSILSGGESRWIGPSPFPIGSSSLHRISAQLHSTASEMEVAKERKRRKGTRLCYPVAQKKNLQKKTKYSEVSANLSEVPSNKFVTKCEHLFQFCLSVSSTSFRIFFSFIVYLSVCVYACIRTYTW